MKSLARIGLSLAMVIGVLLSALQSGKQPIILAQSQALSEAPQQVFQDVLVAPNTALNADLGFTGITGQSPDPKDVALAFTQRTSLLAADPQLGWAAEASEALDSKITVVRLSQMKGQIRIFGAQLAVQVEGGAVRSVAGAYIPSVAANTKPGLTVEDAFKIARQALMEVPPANSSAAKNTPASFEETPPLTKPTLAENELVFFNAAMFDGPSLPTALAYRLVVDESDGSASVTVIVDAVTGKILLRYSNFPGGRNRAIRDASNIQNGGTSCYQESGPVGTPSADCAAAFQYTGATYDYFFSTFGRDSYNNGGATMAAIVRYGTMSNAYWDGQGTVFFGPGFATRDVVAHEWSHAVTQYTAGLIYANQPGAMNESISDIFGAMVDRDDWLMGEDLPIGAIRSMSDPPAYGQPDKVSSYNCTTGDNGGVHTNSGIPNKVAYLMSDGGSFNGRTISGIGRAATEQIFYRALTGSLMSSSNFSDLNNALLSAAAALYGQSSAQYTATQTAAQAVELTLPVACGGSVTPDAYDANGNSDNSAAQATLITGGAVQDHNFHVAGDQDWLKFNASAGSAYTIATLNLQSSADTVLTLYGTNGTTVLATNDDTGGTRASRIDWTATGNGTFFVRVSSYGDLGGANQGYQVQLTAPAPQSNPDAFEPDDSQAAAQPITVGGAIQDHTFHIAGDQDWVSFSAVSGTPYVIETSDLGALSDTVLALYTSSGTLLASNDDTNGRASRIAWTAPSSGSYAVKVWNYSSTVAGVGTNYRLRITGTVLVGDAYEPDNSSAAAQPITVGSAAQSHTFHVAGDQDWVSFAATFGNAYVVETMGLASGNDTVLDLYNSSGTLLDSNDDFNGLASRVGYTPSANEQLFVRVRHYSVSVGNPNLLYSLQVTATPVTGPDANEPDNTPAQARLITPGTPDAPSVSLSTFHVAGDTDWVKFQTTVGNVYTFETVNLEDRCDTFITLFGPDGSTSLMSDDDGGVGLGSRIVWTAPSSAVYFLRVNHYSPSVGGIGTGYTLRIWVVGTNGDIDAYEPDDSAATASAITINVPAQEHTFHIAGDQDWASFTARQGVEYTITTADLGTRTDTILELYDNAGTTLLAYNDDYSGLASQVVWTAPSDGVYRAKVYDYLASVGGPNTSYTLRIIGNEGDSYEPDNTLNTAKPISVNGAAQTHTFHLAGDQDWASFTAAAGSTYTISTANLDSCSDTVLELYNSTSSLLAFNDDFNGFASRIVWPSASSESLFVKVRHFNTSSSGACTAYDLQVTGVAEVGDSYEPDNVRTTARPISVNGAVQAHTFHVAGDQDWVSFAAAAGSTYTILTSDLGSCSDTVLELYDSGNNLLATNDDYSGYASRIIWIATENSTLYSRVRHYSSSVEGPCTSYNLAATSVAGAAPDGFEPDNTLASASSFTVNGASQTHTFHTASDQDWVSFSAVVNTTYTLYTFNLGADSDTVLTLYDSTGATQLAFNDDSSGFASRIVWTAPATGNYRLLARPFGSTGGRANTNYSLMIVTGVALTTAALPEPTIRVGFVTDINLAPAAGDQLQLTAIQVKGDLRVGSEFTTVVRATGSADSYKLNAGAKPGQLELVAIQPFDATGQAYNTEQLDSQTLWQAQQVGPADLAVTQPWAASQETSLVALRWRIVARPEGKLLTLPISLIGRNSDGTTWQGGSATVVLPVASDIKIESLTPSVVDLGLPAFLSIRASGMAGELPKVYLVDINNTTETQLATVSYAPGSSDTLIANIPADIKIGTYKVRLSVQSGAIAVSAITVQVVAAGGAPATATPTATPKQSPTATATATPTEVSTPATRVFLPLLRR